MSSTRLARVRALGSVLALLAGGAFASCAEARTEGAPPRDDGGTTTVPETDAGGDASFDGDAASAPLGCDQADWCPVVAPGIDTRHALTAVWGSGKDDVWAVGSSGTIVHWDGSAWTTIPSGTKQTLRGVWGSGPSDVWIVSTPTLVLHGTGYQGSATTFDAAPEIPRVVTHLSTLTHAVWGTSASDVWLAGEAVPLDWDIFEHAHGWRSGDADAGAPWENMSIGKRTDRVTIRSLWGSGSNDVWAVGGDTEIVFGDDGAEIAISRGRAFHTSGGAGAAPSWTEIDTQSNAVLTAVWGTAGGDVWAVGRRGTIRRMKPGAPRWEVVPSPTTAHLHGLWGAAADDVWAVGDDGTLLHFDGASWTAATAAFPLGPKPAIHAVWGSGPTDVWAVSENGILHFTGKKPGGEP